MSNYKDAVPVECSLSSVPQKRKKEKQQEDRDESALNSLDGQHSFEAPPECLQEDATKEMFSRRNSDTLCQIRLNQYLTNTGMNHLQHVVFIML